MFQRGQLLNGIQALRLHFCKILIVIPQKTNCLDMESDDYHRNIRDLTDLNCSLLIQKGRKRETSSFSYHQPSFDRCGQSRAQNVVCTLQ